MKKIMQYINPYKWRMIGGFVIKVIGTIMDLFIPMLLKFIVDDVIPSSKQTGEIKELILYGILMLICCIVGLLGNVFANQKASLVARNVTTDLRHDLFKKIESLNASQVDNITVPSLISRMTDDTYNIHNMVGIFQRIGVRAPILLLGGIIVTFSLDPILTLTLLILLPIIGFISYFVSKSGLPLFRKVQDSIDNMVRKIRETTTGIRVIKALSKEKYEQESFEKVNKEIMNHDLTAGYKMSYLNPIINLCLNVGLVLVLVVGAYRVIDGTSKAGSIIAFTTYFTIILNAMLSITRIFMIASRSIASASRIEYIFNIEEDLVKEEIEEEKSIYHIEFRNVDFSYNHKKNNLTNINFKLKKGQSLGIIGSTGSGKTTIINLLLRFYDVDKGEILINGKNIKSFDKDELRKMFGVVFQNDTIFLDTIKENIRFGRDISFEDIKEAARLSKADEFINNKVDTYEMMLSSKGTNISGGQKQRLLIARSIASKPEILILDDASSALDYKTDAELRKNLKLYLTQSSSIIITQRISSIVNCDYIMILEEGEIVGFGKHDDLLLTSNIYKEIYTLQMGGGNHE